MAKGNFCRVVGIVKDVGSRCHVVVLRLSKLVSTNKITTHLLETRWIRMKLRRLAGKGAAAVAATVDGVSGVCGFTVKNFFFSFLLWQMPFS